MASTLPALLLFSPLDFFFILGLSCQAPKRSETFYSWRAPRGFAQPANQRKNREDALKIVLAADSAGKPLLDVIAGHLAKGGQHQIEDLSQSGFYADTAAAAAQAIVAGRFDRGVFFCGTGIGVCISANKVPGIRAAQTHDTYSAERAAKSNNAQIITMGARVIGPELAKAIVDVFLASDFDEQGSSAGNVAAINKLDAGKGA
jgi:RpiB/LacA/LacB family sugar-phosphate isomerase